VVEEVGEDDGTVEMKRKEKKRRSQTGVRRGRMATMSEAEERAKLRKNTMKMGWRTNQRKEGVGRRMWTEPQMA
jgi:hypothetical protein